MKVTTDKVKKQIIISMTEKEMAGYDISVESNRVTVSIMDEEPLKKISEAMNKISSPRMSDIISKAFDEAYEDYRNQEIKRPQKPAPRVENLFPGFKRPEPKKIEARGFLGLKCGTCGKRTLIFAKEPISEFECKKYGDITAFTEPLESVDYQCKCGNTGTMHVNHDELIILKCKYCGESIQVQ